MSALNPVEQFHHLAGKLQNNVTPFHISNISRLHITLLQALLLIVLLNQIIGSLLNI